LIPGRPGHRAVVNTITLQMGPQVVLAKIKMRPSLSIEEAVHHINELELRIKQTCPGWAGASSSRRHGLIAAIS
jgi:hypothetical protein